ncbi:3-hydroxyisobutyrate dehydrogenase, mitochondrial [Grifola frondosa]|uniref:3-hydroxyisobutyrate dehydrogenase n=1 Tax=Grifola frondosa TaxID=5627 RepID=A0A1C7MFP7_GRIFR|nr:3-hydroxyisobutyrate dehydrogenase, mitochondrial [Grifola frondosa]
MKPSLRLLQAAAIRNPLRQKSVSFIGLGRMGSEMAHNLFSRTLVESNGGARFVVCDAREETSHAFVKNFLGQFPGAQVDVATTPAEAVLASQTVVTMLPSSPHVRSVYSESGGIIPALRTLTQDASRSTLCIDSTTLDVEVARTVASDVVRTGAIMVDAPVSGGVTGAKAGTLSFLVGGTASGFDLASPILARMGKKIIYCGESGTGLAAKICNNLILGVLAGVINCSTGACWSSSVNNPVPFAVPDKSSPAERDYEGGFATSLMLKDMGLAKDLAESIGSPLPLGEAAESIYADVVREDPELANKDFSSVYRYLGSEFPKVLQKPNVHYRQANLTVPSTVATCFDPPEGQEPYSYVFDLTGEIQWDRPEQVHINHTFRISHLIGLEAARRKVAAYVRIQHPFYECKEKGSHNEKEDVKPEGALGTWWHETLRALGAIGCGRHWCTGHTLTTDVRNSRAVAKHALYTDLGCMRSRGAILRGGWCYGYLKQPMKGCKFSTHTVHIDDVVGALWACAEWMAKIGRKEADAIAGEEIVFRNDKNMYNVVDGMEDDSKVTLYEYGSTLASFFGTTFEFHNIVLNTMAKFTLESVLEEINEVHVKHVVAFSAEKLKEIIGYKLKRPYLNHETIGDMISKLKAENSWPINDP